jgi:branched-chain amino acid transport system ATP-binding protein
VLTLDGVEAAYGPSRVLHGVSLEAREGEVVSLLGRNGAGKSTTLKAMMGLVDVIGGSMRLDGRELRGLPTHEIARLGVGWVPEDRRIFSDLSVEENLLVGARSAGGRSVDRIYAHFPALGRMAARRGGSLSGGEQQMLTVARTLMGHPRILLLDEPSEGLAPVIVQALGQQIAALKREGLTIVLSEQNLKFAARLADRAYIMEKGQIRWEGPMARLMEDEAVRRAYLTV